MNKLLILILTCGIGGHCASALQAQDLQAAATASSDLNTVVTGNDATVAPVLSDSVAPADSVGSLYESMHEEMSKVTVDPETDDWKKRLLSGKLDLNDESVRYPSFLQVCLNVYRWCDRAFNSYDPQYVIGTGKKCKVQVKNIEWMDTYFMRFSNKDEVFMRSNISASLGAYVSYMAVSLGYMSEVNRWFDGVGSGQKRMEFAFTCSRITAEMYYSKNTESKIIRFGNYNDGHPVSVMFPGLSRESYGSDIYYYFNNKKYSQGAAYCYSKIQLKSAGSFIAGITMSHQNIGLNFDELPEDMKAMVPTEQKVYRFKYNDFCFLLGYGYNWVFKKNWLLNISALPSIGFKHCFADNIDGYGNRFSANVKGKIGLVYNHGNWFYAMGLRMDGHWYKSKEHSFFSSEEGFNINVGYRFDIF